VSSSAQEQLAAQQKQAKEHLAEQLRQMRASLDGEISSSHKTIASLKDQIAQLQAEKLKWVNSGGSLNLVHTTRRSTTPQPDETVEAKAKKERTMGILGQVDFDENRPLGEQLKEALGKHAIRVLDLFRDWDTNNDGVISKTEFRKAMPLLGFDLPIPAIDAVFNEYDIDGSGKMEFSELQKMLKGRPTSGKLKAAAKATALAVKKR